MNLLLIPLLICLAYMSMRNEIDDDMILDPTHAELIEACRKLEIEKRNQVMKEPESDMDQVEWDREDKK